MLIKNEHWPRPLFCGAKIRINLLICKWQRTFFAFFSRRAFGRRRKTFLTTPSSTSARVVPLSEKYCKTDVDVRTTR